jgi:hypothetical protein
MDSLRLSQFLKHLVVLEKFFANCLCNGLLDFVLNFLRVFGDLNSRLLSLSLWLFNFHHSTLLDFYRLTRFVTVVCLDPVHFFDNFLAAFNSAENNVFAIKMRSLTKRDKELGAICVSTGISTREQVLFCVLDLEVFISKLLTVNRLASCAVALGEVSSLSHEATDDPVEAAILEVKHLTADSGTTSFACAKLSEVFSCAWNDVLEEFKNDGSFNFATHFDFEVDAWIARAGEL